MMRKSLLERQREREIGNFTLETWSSLEPYPVYIYIYNYIERERERERH